MVALLAAEGQHAIALVLPSSEALRELTLPDPLQRIPRLATLERILSRLQCVRFCMDGAFS